MPAAPTAGRRASLLVFAASFALYLLTYSTSSDGQILGNDVVPYAVGLVEGHPGALWNPHHLLFHPLAWLLSAGAGDVHHVLFAQQVLSSLGGAFAVLVVFRLARELSDPLAALGLTLVFALASGSWLYAAVGETYTPATAALAGLLAATARDRLGLAPARTRSLALWLLAAVLLRQDSVLVVPALALCLPPRTWIPPTAVAGFAALALYVGAWQLSGTEQELVPWLRGLAETGNWGAWGGPESWKVSAVVTSMSLSYLTFQHPAAGLVIAAAVTVALLPLRSGARLLPGRRRLALGLGAFCLARFFFFAWWQPSNMEYHAGTLLPLALLGALALPSIAARQVPALWAAALAVGLSNAVVLILPNRGAELERRARLALETAGPTGLVLATDPFQQLALQRERAGARTGDVSALMPYADDPPEELRDEAAAWVRRIDRARDDGGRVVFASERVLAERIGWAAGPVLGLVHLIPGGEGGPLEEPAEGEVPWAWVLPAR